MLFIHYIFILYQYVVYKKMIQINKVNIKMMWTDELAGKAAQKHIYIWVYADQKQRKYKLLSGAEGAWSRGLNTIFIPSLRLTGLEEDVRCQLRQMGKSDDAIDMIVSTAYTKENHGDDYQKELKQLLAYRSNYTSV